MHDEVGSAISHPMRNGGVGEIKHRCDRDRGEDRAQCGEQYRLALPLILDGVLSHVVMLFGFKARNRSASFAVPPSRPPPPPLNPSPTAPALA